MGLCTMKELIDKAHDEKYAVPAFNVCNLETIQGILECAEELHGIFGVPVDLLWMVTVIAAMQEDHQAQCPGLLEDTEDSVLSKIELLIGGMELNPGYMELLQPCHFL